MAVAVVFVLQAVVVFVLQAVVVFVLQAVVVSVLQVVVLDYTQKKVHLTLVVYLVHSSIYSLLSIVTLLPILILDRSQFNSFLSKLL